MHTCLIATGWSTEAFAMSNKVSSMFSLGLLHKNRAYFENSGAKWSKFGSFVEKHHILHVADLIFG